MTYGRLALASSDAVFNQELQQHLKAAAGCLALIDTLDAVRKRLGHDVGGVLLVAALRPDDIDEIVRLVQEIRLRQWSTSVVVLESESMARSHPASYCDHYVGKRLTWPKDSGELSRFIKDNLGRGRSFLGTEEEAIIDVIGRQLLAQSPSLQMMVEPIALAASYDVPVLLSGET